MTHKKWFITDRAVFYTALMLTWAPYSFFPHNRNVRLLCDCAALALMIVDIIAGIFVTRWLKKEGKYQKDPGYNPNSRSTTDTVRGIILGMVGVAVVIFSLYTIGEEVSIGLKVLGEAAFMAYIFALSYGKYKRIFLSPHDGEQEQS